LGARSFSPFEGESTENRWWDVDGSVFAAGVESEATEFVDDLRKPMNETESRLLLRGTEVPTVGTAPEDCRGTREIDTEGEPPPEGCRTLGVDPSSLSITPNSFVEKLVGDTLVDVDAIKPLVRLVVNVETEFFNVGEAAADVRLEMRGILVGVSFGSPEVEFNKEDGGSLPSCNVRELLVPVVPTEGEPAMVGSWLRLRREVSDCFCIELTV